MIHHSAVNIDSTAESIAAYHGEHNGWPGIGYSFVVRWDGSVEWCHDLDVMSYHVAGRNRECLGICLPGDWSVDHPPARVLIATLDLLHWLRPQLPAGVRIVGHRDIALPGYGTSCPGDSWSDWRICLAI